jgi:putative ABC transport system permease protein
MEISASWQKVFRELWENKTRAFLVLLALVVGVVSVGTVAVTYSILIREMDKNYLYTDPASATLSIESLDETLVQMVRRLPQIARAEARAEIVGRFQIAPGEWRELWLYVVPDFNNIQVDKFTPEQGKWPPAPGEILLERTAVGIAQAKIDDKVIIKLPGNKEQTLLFTGTVHAPGLPPAWVEARVYGYITPETLALFKSTASLDQLKILVAKDEFDETAIRNTVNELKNWLAINGHTVNRVNVPVPGKHPHADLMAAFITMLGISGLFTLIMSSILVTNMITAMIGKQIRQIGIMKAIGGGSNQIAGIYLTMVLVLGILALSIGLPISLAAGRILANYEAVQMLNFEIFNYQVDLWVYILLISVGLLIPILAAANPIIRGSRITVLDALSDSEIRRGFFGANQVDRWLTKIDGASRTFLLSLRNLFRRRSRLILTLLTLTVAGTNFITALNVTASIDQAIAKKFSETPYDIEIVFSQKYPQNEIEQTIQQDKNVASVETWGGAQASIVLPDGTLGKSLRIVAPHINSRLSPHPPIITGRWLRPDDQNGIVLNIAMMKLLNINAAVGNDILLDIQGKKTVWQLVGISQEFMTGTAYVSYNSFTEKLEKISQATNVVVKATQPGLADMVTKNLEIKLNDAGYNVYTLWKTEDIRQVIEKHMVLISGILLVMAAMFVIVGGLGLASTMSLNILDRTRELGIIRAIGATTQNVIQIIVLEGAFVGGISWGLSIILSIPYNILMSWVFDLMLKSPIDLTNSYLGWSIWLFVIIFITSIASGIPAWNAARQPIHDVLAYE